MKTRLTLCSLAFVLTAEAGVYGLKPDASPDRVEAPLSVSLRRIGTLRPRSTREIPGSSFTIGCEGIERDFAKFDEYRDFLGPLGIRRVRIQTGWAKCEPERGRYDFRWLDEILAYLDKEGIRAMFELSYGNPIYPGGGERSLGAHFPQGEEALAGWDRWVDAMTRHFGTRVDWSVWNEPGRKGPEATAAFSVRTAKIIRRNAPKAHVSGLSLEHVAEKKWEQFVQALGSDAKLFDRFLYHGYFPAPEEHIEHVKAIRDLCAQLAPGVEIGQGENGCPSEMLSLLGLRQYPWSEYSQGKWFLRRMLTDLTLEVPSSLFLICDLVYKKVGKNPDEPLVGINAKGLLRTNTDCEVVGVKRAYYAVQNAASVFDSRVELLKDPQQGLRTDDLTLMTAAFRRRDNGARIFAFWQCRDVVYKKWQKYPPEMILARPTDRFETRPLAFSYAGKKLSDPVWVDLFTGRVYAFPKSRIAGRDGKLMIFDVPGYDSPCLLAERAALEIEGCGK